MVETAPDSDDLTFDEMVEACTAAGLARQKIPEQLEIYPGPLPRNATLKILKHKLRELYEARRPVYLERREVYEARQEEGLRSDRWLR